MPSNAYFAELETDPCLRRLVIWSAIMLAMAGAAALVTLPLPWFARSVAVALWAWSVFRELRRLRACWAGVTRLRFMADGNIFLLGQDGQWRPGTLVAGGILLQRVGWIRIRAPGGAMFAEPLRGSCRTGADWRRLQVIWRHVGARP